MDRYAVIGNPVEHSLSPVIHQLFATQTGERLIYEKLASPVEEFVKTVEGFFATGGLGLNVTVPFKEQAAGWVDELRGDARVAGVVNTIARVDSGYCGFNTDGVGLVRDLTVNLGLHLAGQRVLLLGAGCAARGVVRPLLAQGLRQLSIANRNADRAVAMVANLVEEYPHVELHALALDQARGEFDVVINATSAGLNGLGALVDASAVRESSCYDLVYGGVAGTTAFCDWARAAGARFVTDGLGMLVEQAAEAFHIWRGVRPDTRPVLAQLREPLQ